MQVEPPIEEPPALPPVTDPLAPWRVIGTEGFENRTTDPISDMDSERGNSISEMQADDGNRVSEMDEDRGNRISGM